MLPTINGRTLEGNCDLCFLKGVHQVYSIIATDRDELVRKGHWWARMESSVVSGGKFTGDGARFRSDRPSYQQMLDYSDTHSTCSPTTTRPLPASVATDPPSPIALKAEVSCYK